jgi:hypothetical protein
MGLIAVDARKQLVSSRLTSRLQRRSCVFFWQVQWNLAGAVEIDECCWVSSLVATCVGCALSLLQIMGFLETKRYQGFKETGSVSAALAALVVSYQQCWPWAVLAISKAGLALDSFHTASQPGISAVVGVAANVLCVRVWSDSSQICSWTRSAVSLSLPGLVIVVSQAARLMFVPAGVFSHY